MVPPQPEVPPPPKFDEVLPALMASNRARLDALSARKIGINPFQVVEARVETLVDCFLGTSGEQREMYEFVYESAIATILDSVEEQANSPDAQLAMANATGRTASGLVIPGQ